jgi:putative membrane protein insertion efficiency factor
MTSASHRSDEDTRPPRLSPASGALAALAVLPIRAYQLLVSPLLGPRCRYHPTCSAYAIDAVRSFGILRGLVLAGWRLLRCNPWSRGGVDPVEAQRLFGRRPAPPAPPAATSRS